MAVSLVQSVQMLNSTASATTYTGAPTITTSGGLAIAYISGESDTAGATPSISSLTLGGAAMTLQGAFSFNAGGRAWSAIAILNNASVSAGVISITTTAIQRAMAITVAEWTGHDTTTPIDQTFGNNAGSGSTSVSVSAALTNAGGVYTGVCTVDSGTPGTSIVANATETVFGTSGSTGASAFSDNSWQGGYEPHPTTGTYSFGFKWTGANYSTLRGVEIKASAASGSTGSASGTGSASATGQATIQATGSAAGSGSATGVAASTGSVATAGGTGAASGTGQATIAAVGSASGAGAAAGIAGGGSVAAASGVGTVAGAGQATIAATGASLGAGAATGAGQSTVAAAGSAAGTGAASGAGRTTIAAIGSAAGSGQALATALVAGSVGAAAGSSAAIFIGNNGIPIVLTGIWPGIRDGTFIPGPRGADPIAPQRSITGL